ncbi:MAG: lipid-A-disaccharide synthase, partial [Planctomyces sp.]
MTQDHANSAEAAPRAAAPATTSGSGGPARSGILFTAFEPSGDDHASIVIAELKRLYPTLPIYAWGGRKMEAAGATIVERTGQSAVMGVPGLGKILEHVRINHRIEDWLETHRVAMHIPVDSPDANFPICAMAKDRGMRVVHLVAPQLWAWREGRIKKLRRLTDLVLCLLPFEEQWFMSRGVPARFVGHPLFSESVDHAEIAPRVAQLATQLGPGTPRIALMPGSRPVEIRRSLPPLIDAFVRLRADFPNLRAVFPVTTEAVREQLLERIPKLLAANGSPAATIGASGLPKGLSIVVGDTDTAVAWCDLAIVASGTVTLQVARQNKPMVTFYCFSRFW